MKSVFVKINGFGEDVGDYFLIFADIGGTYPTFASKSDLLTGITVVVDNDLATKIIIMCDPIGVCKDPYNNIELIIDAPTTTTTTTIAPTTTTTTTLAPTTTTTTLSPTTTTTTTCGAGPYYYDCGSGCMEFETCQPYPCVPCYFPTTTTTTTISSCELIVTIDCNVITGITTTTTTTLDPTTTTTTLAPTTTTTLSPTTTTTTTTLPILCLDTAAVVNFEQNGGGGLNQFKIDLTVPVSVTSDSNFIVSFTATRINTPFNTLYVNIGLTILNGNTTGVAYTNQGLVQTPIELYVITNVLINLYPIDQFTGIICSSTTTTTTTSAGTTTTTTTDPIPLLRITEVTTDCVNSDIIITIVGGLAPYYYSVDNGKTLIQSNNTTYTFINLTGGIYDVYVRDSNTSFDMWVEQNCNPVKVIFETVYFTQYANGQIYDENFVPYTTSFSATKSKGTLYSTSSTVLNGTTFLGWSLVDINGNKPSKLYINKINYLSKNYNYVHEFDHDTTVYAIFDKSGPAYKDFCYFPTPVGYAATDADLAYYCPNCSQTVRVYYNENQYNTIGFEKITWYKDVNLTITVDTGYYKLVSDTKTLIYRLANGLSTYGGSCPSEPNLLSCC